MLLYDCNVFDRISTNTVLCFFAYAALLMALADNALCVGRVPYPFVDIEGVMLIAVGVGVAPMIQTIRAILTNSQPPGGCTQHIRKVVLLYGVVCIVIYFCAVICCCFVYGGTLLCKYVCRTVSYR